MSARRQQRERPDWVICLLCRTVYAPTLVGAIACPKCGDPRWEPSAIPDAEEPLEPPVKPWPPTVFAAANPEEPPQALCM